MFGVWGLGFRVYLPKSTRGSPLILQVLENMHRTCTLNGISCEVCLFMKILNFSGSSLSLHFSLLELLFNSAGLLVRSWLFLHTTLCHVQ